MIRSIYEELLKTADYQNRLDMRAYWLIGKKIVEEEQQDKHLADHARVAIQMCKKRCLKRCLAPFWSWLTHSVYHGVID
jgi:hypothetical protein